MLPSIELLRILFPPACFHRHLSNSSWSIDCRSRRKQGREDSLSGGGVVPKARRHTRDASAVLQPRLQGDAQPGGETSSSWHGKRKKRSRGRRRTAMSFDGFLEFLPCTRESRAGMLRARRKKRIFHASGTPIYARASLDVLKELKLSIEWTSGSAVLTSLPVSSHHHEWRNHYRAHGGRKSVRERGSVRGGREGGKEKRDRHRDNLFRAHTQTGLCGARRTNIKLVRWHCYRQDASLVSSTVRDDRRD